MTAPCSLPGQAGLAPRPGFDWSRVKWLAPDEPLIAAGEDSEKCSYCGDAIPEDSVPLRACTTAGWAALFCDACMVTWWGFDPPADSHAEWLAANDVDA